MQATPAWDRERVVRRLAPAVPVALSLGAWAAGSGAVLRHVLLADDFVSAEIRRHGLVTELVRTLAAFSLPYLVAGLVAAWVARGLVRLVSPRPSPPGARDAWLGGVITVCLLGTAVLFALVERPANFAGIFWQRGGALRSVHRVAEAWTTPAGIAWGTGFVAAVAFAATSVGWWRHAPAGRRRASVATLGMAVAAFASAPLTWRAGSVVDPSRPNVLVLVVDSLRPDRLDGSTAAMGVAPALYAISSGAVRFTNARTPSALTYPSMTSLLTALHPTRHGIRSHYPSDSERALTVETLPKRLRAAGWSTIAVGGYCSTVLREVDFGFDHYRLPRSEVDLIVSAVALRGHPWLPST